MIGRQYPGSSVDELAVRRDDEVLELLRRRCAPREPDVASALLWALTLDVDRESLAIASEPVPVDVVGARRHGARGTVLGVVVAAALSVSGVAAAVTGDPLSPYRAVISLAQDDEPPVPRRGTAPDPATIRREGATTRQADGVVAAPDVALGRAAVARGGTTGAGKQGKQDPTTGRPDGTIGKPASPGRSADRASEAQEAQKAKAEKAAKAAKAAQHAAELDRAERDARAQRARAARPETKEQRDKP